MSGLWRIDTGAGVRLARGAPEAGPEELLDAELTVAALLSQEGPGLDELDELPAAGPVPDAHAVRCPLDAQEVWAAGVTYERSRDARMEESGTPDHYDHVYDAARPEIFFKATAERARGPEEPIGVRADSTWDVPEPELGLVVDAGGQLAGYVVGDDVSSRSIEGENPLYLPQAKVYTGSCAVGPCLVPRAAAPPSEELRIRLSVQRDGDAVYDDAVAVRTLRRTPEELVAWLCAALDFPRGAVLLSGTAIVPPDDFTLLPGDRVAIAISGVGELVNPVERVGAVVEPWRGKP